MRNLEFSHGLHNLNNIKNIIANRRIKMKKGYVLITLFVILCVVGFISIVILMTIPLRTQEWVEITPTEKIVKVDGTDSKYLIFTDNEVYQNTDEFILGKFDSSDIYRDLEVGKTYNCLVVGHRVHFLSWYRNIIKCERSKYETTK